MNRVEEIAALLQERHLTLGTAESCTGGRIANLITSYAGSSSYFKGGIVSYCNEVKHRVLGVSEEDLAAFGAVSQPVVEQMAKGAIRVLNCDCAVATSGIAGPGGAVPGKPVGTVWIAAAYKDKIISRCFNFPSDRIGNIEASAEMALELLWKIITPSQR